MNEVMAHTILRTACDQHRAAALLDCLFNGGSCTVDPGGDLVLIDGELLASLVAGADDDEPDSEAPPDSP